MNSIFINFTKINIKFYILPISIFRSISFFLEYLKKKVYFWNYNYARKSFRSLISLCKQFISKNVSLQFLYTFKNLHFMGFPATFVLNTNNLPKLLPFFYHPSINQIFYQILSLRWSFFLLKFHFASKLFSNFIQKFTKLGLS